jgi:arsenate reductase
MTERTYNVLFLCTGNTARSILAEGILRKDGAGRFNAYSAGSQPKGTVNPFALKVLEAYGYPVEGYRSKSWEEFARPRAPVMDFVFTVCDSAAGEACPVWPGHPTTAHWGIEDPAAVQGSDIERERAFVQAFQYLKNRITAFTSLPIASLDGVRLRASLQEIGRSEGATSRPPKSPNARLSCPSLNDTSPCGWPCASWSGLRSATSLPEVFQTIGAIEFAKVNLPVAALIWLMIVPMLIKIDFASLGRVREHWRGIGVTLFINWAVKPFSMAALGWFFIGYLFRPYLPSDQINSYIAGLIILAAAPARPWCSCGAISRRANHTSHSPRSP